MESDGQTDGDLVHYSKIVRYLKAEEPAPDGHNFADALHGTADFGADVDELAQIPARDLDDAVIHGRLETRRCRLRHRVAQHRKRYPQRQLTEKPTVKLIRVS